MTIAATLESSENPTQRFLKGLLTVKIVLTVFLWALPFLLAPRGLLEQLMGPVPEPIFNLRLLGLAYLALAVGYVSGLAQARRGVTPTGVMLMGVVSNGGASIMLLTHLLTGGGAALSGLPALLTWFSFIAVTLITVGLLYVIAKLRD